MKTLKKLVGILFGFVGLGFIGTGFVFFVGTPRQKESDARFRERFTPIISYIEEFHTENSRYPNKAEFEDWKENHQMENQAVFLYISTIPSDSDFQGQIEENKEYIISMWRGEWDVYYIAQENRFYPGGWGYDSAFGQFLFCSAIGAVFLAPCWFLIRTKQTNTQQDAAPNSGDCAPSVG